MKTVLAFAVTCVLMSSCAGDPKPTVADHAAALQVYDRDIAKLSELEATLSKKAEEIRQQYFVDYVKSKKTGALPPRITDASLAEFTRLAASPAMVGDSPDAVKLREKVEKNLKDTENAKREWNRLETEFDLAMSVPESPERKQFDERCQATEEFKQAAAQKDRVQSSKEQLDTIELKMK